jgi:FKBP-type peptidyl-prolyl cis-trans isomerase FkpA
MPVLRLALWGSIALSLSVSAALDARKPASPAQCKSKDFRARKAPPPTRLSSGVWIQTLMPGKGSHPVVDDDVQVSYRGTLRNKKQFDANARAQFPVGGLIAGFTEGLLNMQEGGVYRLCIPAVHAYGDTSPSPDIPAHSILFFDVTLLKIL